MNNIFPTEQSYCARFYRPPFCSDTPTHFGGKPSAGNEERLVVMASGSSRNNRYSNSSTIAKGRVLSSIGGSVTNLSTPRKHTPPIRFTVDELNPNLTRSSWIIHASVTKKRGQVPFSENGQYTEVYLKDVRTVRLFHIVSRGILWPSKHCMVQNPVVLWLALNAVYSYSFSLSQKAGVFKLQNLGICDITRSRYVT